MAELRILLYLRAVFLLHATAPWTAYSSSFDWPFAALA